MINSEHELPSMQKINQQTTITLCCLKKTLVNPCAFLWSFMPVVPNRFCVTYPLKAWLMKDNYIVLMISNISNVITFQLCILPQNFLKWFSILNLTSPFFKVQKNILKKIKIIITQLYLYLCISCVQNQSKTLLYFNHTEKHIEKILL